jgi:hypothetical protein
MRPITRALTQAIPTATVREIDGAAHAVTFDAPDNFIRVIVEAIRRNDEIAKPRDQRAPNTTTVSTHFPAG